MCALFAWSASPDGRISVPGRRAAARHGKVIPGRPRYDVSFVDGLLETSDPAEVAAARAALRTSRGEIQEASSSAAPTGTVDISEAALAAAIERLARAIRRDEELDEL